MRLTAQVPVDSKSRGTAMRTSPNFTFF